ncbi:MAG: cytochrome c biogenesis protein CcsA [Pseudomonadota bacterium]
MLAFEITTTTAYLIATIFLSVDLVRRESRYRQPFLWLLFLGFAFSTIDLILHSIHAVRGGFLPFSGAPRSLSMLSWMLIVIVLYTQAKERWFPVSALLTPIAFVSSLLALFQHESMEPVRGETTTAVFVLHVAVLLFGIGCVCLAFCSALLYLVQQRELKSKHVGRLLALLPPLEVLDRTALRSMILGVVLLTIGNATGIYLAHVYWKTEWLSQKKFVFSMLTWWWFVISLGVRYLVGWRGGRFFALIVVGFIFLLFTLALSVLRTWPWI